MAIGSPYLHIASDGSRWWISDIEPIRPADAFDYPQDYRRWVREGKPDPFRDLARWVGDAPEDDDDA